MSRPTSPEGYAFYGGPFSNFVGGPISVPVAGNVETLFIDNLLPWSQSVVCAPTVEHFFQAAKATSLASFLYVLTSPTPAVAKSRGNSIPLRFGWAFDRWDVMLSALRAKFAIPEFADELLACSDELIYEDSPTDAVWGLWNEEEGAWTGHNQLGIALMRIRDELAANRHLTWRIYPPASGPFVGTTPPTVVSRKPPLMPPPTGTSVYR